MSVQGREHLQSDCLPQGNALDQLVLANAPDIIMLFDRQAKIRYINKVAAGYTREQVLDEDSYQFVLPEDRPFARAAIEHVVTKGEPTQYEIRDAQASRWYAVRLSPVIDAGQVLGAVAICTDVHDRRTAEESLRASHDLLESHIRQRTVELAEAIQRMESDIRRREEVEQTLRQHEEQLRQERRMLIQLIDLHERDRQLIAYEIHDGLVQALTGALMMLEGSRGEEDPQKIHDAGSFEQGIRVIRSSIDEARRLINGLRPPVLDQSGLILAIENLVEESVTMSSIPIQLDIEVQFEKLAPTLENAIYRIVQESLNNVCQHSQASQARVKLQQAGETIRITVTDDGVGFDPAVVNQKRFGLAGVRQRAHLLCGQSHIQSAPGQGTQIHVELPLADALLPSRDAPA